MDGNVTTLAGTGFNWDVQDGIGQAAGIYRPIGLAMTSDGRFIYITGLQSRILQRMDMETNMVTRIAGASGFNVATDGFGCAARFRDSNLLIMSPDETYQSNADDAMIRIIDLDTMHVGRVIVNVKTNKGNDILTQFRDMIMMSDGISVLIAPDNIHGGLGGMQRVWFVNENKCASCSAGTFKPGSGDTDCITCPSGTYTLYTEANGECTNCAIGKYSRTISENNASACQECPLRTKSPEGSTTINDCVAAFETVISFKLDVTIDQITNNIKFNIQFETAKSLDIDFSAVGSLTFEAIPT